MQNHDIEHENQSVKVASDEPASAEQQLANIPTELVNWFNGHGVPCERWGLPRFDIRHRVVEVHANLGDDDNPYFSEGEVREYKKLKAAEACRDEWVKRGRIVILQHAVMLWLTNDELPQKTA